MKKFLLSAFALAVALSAAAFNMAPTVEKAQLGTPMNAKQAPKEMVAKMIQKTIATKAPQAKLNTPVTKASDMEGGYTWNYEMAGGWGVDPDTVATTATGSDPVVFFGADDEAGTVKIAGMFDGVITATIDTETYAQYGVVLFTLSDEDLAANTSNYGACYIKGVFYYDSDDEEEAGWYYIDPTLYIVDDELYFDTDIWMFREIASGTYAGYYLTPLWKPGSELVENDAANGVMEYPYNSFDYASAMEISETEDYVVNINNFAGLADNPVNIYLTADSLWIAEPTVLFSNNNGDYVLYGVDGDSLTYLTGTGTETVLTFDTNWTGYDTETNYWLGERGAGTITLIGGVFVYPEEEVVPDVYILSTNGDQPMATNVGQKMELDSLTNLYTATVTFNGDESGYSYFKFSTKLLEAADDWDNLFPYMFGAVSNGDFLVTDEMIGIELSLKAQNDGGQAFKIPTGEYNLTLNYADMKLKIEKVASSKPGDANGDGNVDVNDVTTTINYILGKNPNPFVFDNANVNDDDDVNVNDVTMIINMILGII